MTPFRATLLVLLMTATTAFSAPPLRLELRAAQPQTLPGIEIDLQLVVENPTSNDLDLNGVMLHAQPAGRSPFWVWDGELNLGGCDPSWIAAKSSVEVPLWRRNAGGHKGLWGDYRLNVPGVYRVRAVVNVPAWAHGSTERPADYLSLASLGDAAVLSNEITITVDDPRGGDAEIWRVLTESMTEEESRSSFALTSADPRIAGDLLQRFPDSGYAPWLAYRLWRTGNGLSVEDFRKRYPKSPLVEQIEYERASRDAIDLSTATKTKPREITAARNALKSFADTAKHPYLRCLAEQSLERMAEQAESGARNKDR